MDTEFLDVVDGHDRIIGRIDREDYYHFQKSGEGFVRVSELYAINDKGQLWTPVRTAHKKIAPNGFDSAAAGHVTSGDDYLETVLREAKEEINLDLTEHDVVFVAKVKNESLKFMRSIYLYHTNQTPSFNPDDFIKGEWLTPEDILRQIDAGHPTKSLLPSAISTIQVYLEGFRTVIT